MRTALLLFAFLIVLTSLKSSPSAAWRHRPDARIEVGLRGVQRIRGNAARTQSRVGRSPPDPAHAFAMTQRFGQRDDGERGVMPDRV